MLSGSETVKLYELVGNVSKVTKNNITCFQGEVFFLIKYFILKVFLFYFIFQLIFLTCSKLQRRYTWGKCPAIALTRFRKCPDIAARLKKFNRIVKSSKTQNRKY